MGKSAASSMCAFCEPCEGNQRYANIRALRQCTYNEHRPLGKVANGLRVTIAGATGGLKRPAAAGPSYVFGLGLGVVSSQKAYAGIDRETKPIPLLQFENKYLKVQGLGLEVKVPSLALSDKQSLNFSVLSRGGPGEGYEASDAAILRGMAERKSSIWAGAKVEWKNPVANVSLDWVGDASKHSKGQKVNFAVSHPWRVNQNVVVTPRVGVSWHDSKYNDYYYGVRSSEIRAGRPAYRADSGANAEVGLSAMYMFNRHHSVMVGAGLTGLSKEVKNSPLVDRSTENRVFMAYSYRF